MVTPGIGRHLWEVFDVRWTLICCLASTPLNGTYSLDGWSKQKVVPLLAKQMLFKGDSGLLCLLPAQLGYQLFIHPEKLRMKETLSGINQSRRILHNFEMKTI